MSCLTFTKDQEDIYTKLKYEIRNISLKWKIYHQLFGSSPKNIEILYNCAEICFDVYNYALYRDIHISIARLLDPPKSNGYKNLSLKRMLYIVKEYDINSNLYKKLKKKYEEIIKLSENIKTIRNKIISHNDLSTLSLDDNYQINYDSRKNIQDTLDTVYSFINQIESEVSGSEISQEILCLEERDGDALTSSLKRLREFEEKQTYIYDSLKEAVDEYNSNNPLELNIEKIRTLFNCCMAEPLYNASHLDAYMGAEVIIKRHI